MGMRLFFSSFVEILKHGSDAAGLMSRNGLWQRNCEALQSQTESPALAQDHRKLPGLAHSGTVETPTLEFGRPDSVCADPLILPSPNFPLGQDGWHIGVEQEPDLCWESISILQLPLHTPRPLGGHGCRRQGWVSWVLQLLPYASVLSNSAAI